MRTKPSRDLKPIEATPFEALARQGGHPLVGRGFHTVDPDGRTQWQGMICAEVGEGHFLCQLFEWVSGGPTTQHVFHITEFAQKHESGLPRFRLFDSIEQASGYIEASARHHDAYIDHRREQ